MNFTPTCFSRRVTSLLWPLHFCILLGTASGSLLAAEPSAVERKARLERVRSMTPEDREALAAEFRKFLDLPADKRAGVQELQAQLEERQHSELKEVMAWFSEWVQELDLADQERFLKLESPEDRLVLLKQLLDRPPGERRSRPEPARFNADRSTPGSPQHFASGDGQVGPGMPRPGGFPLMGGKQSFFVLPQRDLQSTIDRLESTVRPTLSSSQRNELESLQGCPKNLKLMDILLRQELYEKSGGVPAWARDDFVVDKMVSAITDHQFQRMVKRDESPERKRHLLLFAVANSIRVEYDLKYRPSDAKLIEFMNSLPENIQLELKQLPDEEKKSRVYEMYVLGHATNFPKYVREFPQLERQFVRKVFPFPRGGGTRDGRPEKYSPGGDEQRRSRGEGNFEGKPRGPKNFDGAPPNNSF